LVRIHGLVRVDLVVSLDNVRNEEVAFLDIVGYCELWFVEQGGKKVFGVGSRQLNK
jgi:hypothetical protein